MLTVQATAGTADLAAFESLIGPDRAAELRGAADTIRQVLRDHRPENECRKERCRDREHPEHHPHHPARDRGVNEEPGHQCCRNHHDDRANPLDPGSAAVSNGRYRAALDRGARGLRVGFVRHFHEVDMPAEPEVTAALEHVKHALQSLGADVRDIRLPSLGEFAAVNRVILQSEAWAIHGEWLRTRPGDYGKLARRRLMPGAFLAAGDYVLANKRRLEMIAAVNAALAEVDVLLCASSMDPACRIDRPAEVERTYPRQARTPFNVTGHPALAMMSGLSSGGLPLSVQFVGRYFDEAMLFRVARAWEQASGIDKKHPPIG